MLRYSILKADDTSEGSPRMMITIFLVTLLSAPPSPQILDTPLQKNY